MYVVHTEVNGPVTMCIYTCGHKKEQYEGGTPERGDPSEGRLAMLPTTPPLVGGSVTVCTHRS